MTRLARLVFEPLADWPYPDTGLQPSPFDAPWAKTRDLLLREADRLGASMVVVEVDCSRRHLRQDGELRADARLHSGRVRVSMKTRHGPLRYAVDRYDDAGLSWQANLRAVALTLEALRAVERYGAVRDGQQYRGFRALEAGPGNDHGFADATDALSWVQRQAGNGATDPRQAYKIAARRLHPDTGGSPQDWDRLDAAPPAHGDGRPAVTPTPQETEVIEQTDQAAFEGWVVLELMGHRRLAGYVREQQVAGATFLRLDVPGPAGGDPVASQLYAPSAVYCITPTSEDTARRVAAMSRPAPVQHWELPAAPSADEDEAWDGRDG